MKTVRFTRVATVKTTGWLTVDADTDEEAMEKAIDTDNWKRYQELSDDYDDIDWEFEVED